MLSFCGEKYRRRYILGERISSGVELLVGKATDSTVNANLGNKIVNDDLLPMEQIKDLACDYLNTEWNQGEVALDEDEIKEGIKKVKGGAVDKSVRLSCLHASEIAPALSPTHVQRKWEIELKNYPFDLMGFIDVQEGTHAVRDTKTSGKSPAKNAADTSDQLTMYAMAVYALDKMLPEKLTLDFLVDNKTPKSVIVETTRTLEDFKPILARIENAIQVIEKGIFVPAAQDSWGCSPKWCGFFRTCKYARQSIFPVNGGN